MRWMPLLLCAALFTTACDDDDDSGAAGAAGGGGVAGAADTDAAVVEPRESYPTASAGVDEGEVIENLTFVTPDEGSLSFQDLRADGRKSLLLVTTSAGWCSACIEEQPELKAFYEEFSSDGLEILVALFQDSSYEPAEAADAEAWKTRHELPFHVVADPEFSLAAYYDETLTPMNMLVDLESMEIIKIMTGWDGTVLRALVGAKL